jgi:hypothetical protein
MALSDRSSDPPLAVMKRRGNSTMARTLIVMSGSPPSPISSTEPRPTFRLDGSQPIPPGRSARPSRITCCAQPRAGRPSPSPGPHPPSARPQRYGSCTYPSAGLVARLDHPLAQHHKPTIQRLNPSPTRTQQPGPQQEKLGRPPAHSCLPLTTIKTNHSTHHYWGIGGIRFSVRRPIMQFRRRPTHRGSRR